MNKYEIKDYAHKKQVMQYLIDLGNYKKEPKTVYSGICLNMHWALDINGYKLVEKLSINWLYYTGCYNLPVPGDYFKCNWRKNSKQGRLRRELCLHLASELKAIRLSYKAEEAQNEIN